MANRMADVAMLFGIELGEVFFIREYPSDSKMYPDSKMYLKFTENGLERSFDKDSWTRAAGWVWEQLITGAFKINKLPWRPSRHDTYYMPTITSIDKYIKLFWTGSKNDEDSYQQGLVFRTEKEAVELAEEMLDVARKKFAGGTKQEENNG